MLKSKKQNLKVLLLGANSEIGNSILKKSKIGINNQRIYLGRTKDHSTFKDNDVFIKFDALDYVGFASKFSKILEENSVDCVLISYASVDYSTVESSYKSNIVNFNSVVFFADLVLKHFDSQGFGHLIYISSSIVNLQPRTKNFKYNSAKRASDYYFRGLQNQISPKKIKIIIIRPGFTQTKIHKGEIPGPFSTSVKTLARSVDFQLKFGRNVIYAPINIIFPIMFLSLIPTKLLDILDKLNARRFHNSTI